MKQALLLDKQEGVVGISEDWNVGVADRWYY